MKLREQAFVLSNAYSRNTSSVVTLLTEYSGKVSLYVRGFRRITGKPGFQGVGDPLTLGEAVFSPPLEDGRDAHVGQMQPVDWMELQRLPDPGTFAALAHRELVATAVDVLVPPGQEESAIFQLMKDYTEWVEASTTSEHRDDAGPGKDPVLTEQRITSHFLFRLLTHTGHRPVLDRSVLSKRSLPEKKYRTVYSFSLGGVVLPDEINDANLYRDGRTTWPVTWGIIHTANVFGELPLADTFELEIPAEAHARLLDFALVLLEATAERTLRPVKYLRKARTPFGSRC